MIIQSPIILLKVNKREMAGNWNVQKGILKQKFATLTENDPMFAEGKRKEMIGRLQKKLGKTNEEIKNIFSFFSNQSEKTKSSKIDKS